MPFPTTTAKRFLIALIFINFLIILAAGFMMPVWAEFVHKIHGDIRTAGNAICIFSIILGFFTWIAGKIENQIGHEEFILALSQALFAISYLGYFWVKSPVDLYLVQIALGISGAIQVPALYALYERYIPKSQSTFYWGMWAGTYNIAIGVGALISAYTVHHFGFNTMFGLLFSVSLLCFLVILGTMLKIRYTAD
ncbi:MAG TPA: MFS transporter [Gammaproteobacteria bacterium]|nr:MFS transporter [Gammaproteobacteria bacterium]